MIQIPSFIIYNVLGMSIPVDAEEGTLFTLHCPEEECGKEIMLRGTIKRVSGEEFRRVLKAAIEGNSVFAGLEDIHGSFIFEGSVNGENVKLPAESMEEFTERFMKEVFVLTG
ncbi:hypothetical protein JCM16138_19280 [Thermococcus atlanticus]